MENGQRPGEKATYNIEGTNLSMNQAMKKARLTLADFNAALLSQNPDFSAFSLKVRFGTEEEGEHIWISQISIKDGVYYGVVDNLPDATKEVNLDEHIQIDSEHISDWMYKNGNKVRGGYTIRVFRQMMQPAQRASFDKQTGMIFD